MTDITKKANPPDGWTYEASLARAKARMMDKYDEHKITLEGKTQGNLKNERSKLG